MGNSELRSSLGKKMFVGWLILKEKCFDLILAVNVCLYARPRLKRLLYCGRMKTSFIYGNRFETRALRQNSLMGGVDFNIQKKCLKNDDYLKNKTYVRDPEKSGSGKTYVSHPFFIRILLKILNFIF